VPEGVAPPEDVPTEAGSEHFYIGEAQAEAVAVSDEASMYKEALAKLLAHPDEAVRNATREALECVKKTQVDEAATPAADETASVSKASSEDWEKPCSVTSSQEEWEHVPQDAEPAQQAKASTKPAAPVSARVLTANIEVGHAQAMGEVASCRGDASAEAQFAALISQYSKVSQAYNVGGIWVHHSLDRATALAKVIVTNDGSEPWPEQSALRLIAGPAHGLAELPLGAVPAGQPVEIVMDLTLEGQGQSMSAWARPTIVASPLGRSFS
jgi:hypothetical protein